MKQQILFLLCITALITGSLGAFGAGKGESPGVAEPSAVKMLSVWSLHPEEIFTVVANEYKKTHPNVKFEFLSIPWSNAGWAQKCMTALVSGQLPDIVHTSQAPAEWSVPVRGVYRSLNPFLEADNMPVPKEPIPTMRVSTLAGQVYGLPINRDFSLVYYNKTMYAEAGYNRPPQNLDEFLEYTARLTKRDPIGNLTRLGFATTIRPPNQHMALVMNSGGHYFSSDDRSSLHGSPEAIEASKFMIRQKDLQGSLEAHSKLAPSARGIADPFVRETAAMAFFNATAQLSQIDKYNPGLKYGAFPYPAPAGRKGQLIQSGSHVLMITSTSKQPGDAWDFVKFWYENQLLYIKASWNTQASMPGMTPIARSAEYTSLHPALPEMVSFLDSVAEIGQSVHIFATDAHWINQGPAIDKALQGVETPERAQASVQKQVQEELDSIFRRLEERGVKVELKGW